MADSNTDDQRAFNNALVQAAEYASQQDFEKALAVLQNLIEGRDAKSVTPWLVDHVFYHQGNFMRLAGDLPAAVTKFREIAEDVSAPDLRLLRSCTLAKVLIEMGNPKEALHEIRRELSKVDSKTPGVAPELCTSLLLLYRDLIHPQSPSEQYRHPIESVASHFGVRSPGNSAERDTDLDSMLDKLQRQSRRD